MRTGSLRTRVSLITLALLTVVLVGVVTAVTLAYRSKLDGDLRHRLTAAGTAVERARSGAAAKPLVQGLALEELLARVRAVLRRAGRLSTPLEAGDIVVDEQGGIAVRAGRDLAVTPTELRLLAFFVRHRGLVLSKHQLLTQVWGYDAYDPNVVEVHVSALRRKLGHDGASVLETVRGLGYRLTGR